MKKLILSAAILLGGMSMQARSLLVLSNNSIVAQSVNFKMSIKKLMLFRQLLKQL